MQDPRPRTDAGAPVDEAAGAELIAALVDLGVDPGRAELYVRRGDADGAIFDTVLLSQRVARTVSAEEIATGGGLGTEEIAELMRAFGLPGVSPDEPAFTPAEAEVLRELGRIGDVWPPAVQIQVARAYGAMLAGIARAELQAFMLHTQRLLIEQGGDPATQLGELKSTLERLLPLADPLLVGVHRRWIEHELGQRAIRAAEYRAGAGALPGAVEVTFLFCDLKGFTAFAEAEGDEAAIAAIDRFFDVIARERGETGDLVKSLGDGAMLVYEDTTEAVNAALRVIAGMRATEFPGVHASAHRGVAIARSGDYFGGAVNLAARLLGVGARDELIASDVVAGASQDFAWEAAGEVTLHGVGGPVAIHRLRPTPSGA